MADLKWTKTQIQRFKELGTGLETVQDRFSTQEQRNKIFQQIEKKQVKIQRGKLEHLLVNSKKTKIQLLKEKVEQALFHQGFVSVTTPTIITKQALEKMTIDENHQLIKQVFWINEKQCLRPMLAPNLYSLMQDFGRAGQKPIRFFETGSCFRKESKGSRHSSEFTMLNLVEMGLPRKDRQKRMQILAKTVMSAAGINDFHFENEDSTVYGTTMDILAGPGLIEVASGAMGPHPLDAAWGITDTWVGIGFGLERLLMVSIGDDSIGRWSKSLNYIDGICLNI